MIFPVYSLVPSPYFFNNNYIMNSSDKSIADATGKMKQWIVQAYNDVKQEVQQTNSFYSSSLMIQLFLRRVVEINFIEGCYDKVRRV